MEKPKLVKKAPKPADPPKPTAAPSKVKAVVKPATKFQGDLESVEEKPVAASTPFQPAPNPFETANPKTAYFAGKPAHLTPYQWLFDPCNLYGFPTWVSILLQKILGLSAKTGTTYFGQQWLAKEFKCTPRWIRELLRRLEKIGVIEVIRPPGRRNFYRLSAEFVADVRERNRQKPGRFPPVHRQTKPKADESEASSDTGAPDSKPDACGSPTDDDAAV